MSCRAAVAVAVAVATLAAAVRIDGAGGADYSAGEHRLPRDTRPVAYGLQLAPKYDQGSGQYGFAGHVQILIAVDAITPNVTLNAVDLQIESVAVVESKTQKDLVVDNFEPLPDVERLVIYLGSNMLAGHRYEVKIAFQSYLRPDMTGFYRSMYTENGITNWMAVTQFKPTYARRAFPCYDEPSYKTPFNVSLLRLANQMSLSNMPRYLTQNLGYYGLWIDHFETTPPIPTYSVAALVGVLRKSSDVEGSNVTVYTSEDYLSQTDYVVGETPELFRTMENYTGIPIQVKKIEFLSVPDFDGESAENWGLNTYRERYMLFGNDSKTKFKEQSTMIIQQQNSHQWFGNLVTCSWWDFLWLNEGFARYFQYFATKTVKPDWRLEELFVVEQHQAALEFDQTPRHPVTASVKTSDQIQGIFDRVTYNKAAAILRMLKYTVSDSNFHEPLKLYLKHFEYNTVSPSQLWAEFENYYFDTGFKFQEDVSFTNFIVSWTDQSGYPVINVSKENGTYTITQNKFSICPDKGTTAEWYIGLTYTNDLAKNFEDLGPVKWLKPSTVTHILDSSLSTWFIFNLQSTGFYRVNYDQGNWIQLVQLLNVSHDTIHVLNRAQLLDDSLNLARAGLLNYSTALDLTNYLNKENDDIPWYTAMDCLSYVVERMRRSAEGYDYIKSYVRNLAELVYRKTEALVVEHHSEHHVTLTSWNKFSVWACSLDGEYCTKNALEYFSNWTAGDRISPDIKDAAFCTGIKTSNNTDTWNEMFNVYTTTKSASEKNSAQTALTCARDTLVLYKYLDLLFDSMDGGPVRLQDFKDICDSMSSTPQGIEALTNFLLNRIEQILRTVPTGESIVKYVYRILASRVALDDEILKLYKLKNAAGLPSSIKASFDESYVQVELNLNWYNNYHVAINEWTGAPAETPTTIPTTPTPSTEPTPTNSTPMSSTTESISTTEPTPANSTTKPTPTNSTTESISTTGPTPTNSTTESISTTEPTPTNSTTEPTPTNWTTESISTNSTTEPITIKPFDFDSTTPAVISRCPSKGGIPSYRSGSPALVVAAVVVVSTIVCSRTDAMR